MEIKLRTIAFIFGIALTLLATLSACSPPPMESEPAADKTEPTAESLIDSFTDPAASESPEEIPPAPLDVARIGIHLEEGTAEFYHTGSGESFVVRGFNYIDFIQNQDGQYEDRVMASDTFDPERVRDAFAKMHTAGYNTVRIFFDICGAGHGCLGSQVGEGFNPAYLDNMTELMQIAGEEGIYIIFTANTIPDDGGYWEFFDNIFNNQGHLGFEDRRNADWLHTAGVETKRKVWRDLLSGLIERNAPFETVLGWQLTNEFWLWGDAPPLSLAEGVAETANGLSYDMSDPTEKRQMVVDGMRYFIEQISGEIKSFDPEALTTMGFFAPYFRWDGYIVTPELLQDAAVDFWDFHAYFDTELSIQEQIESFGMADYSEKPVVMGETGGGHGFIPSAAGALTKGVQWMIDSCELGFDGWLYWGYYPWPDVVGGAAWAPLEADDLIFNGMAPNNMPDPCELPELEIYNAAYLKPVTASRSLPENPPALAVDGGSQAWNSGQGPTGWIEVDLLEATSIGQIALVTEQWPPGITRHQLTARLDDGTLLFLGQLYGFTTADMGLKIELPQSLDAVQSVRIATLESPAWVGWREIDVITEEPGTGVCIATVNTTQKIYQYPEIDAAMVGDLTAGTKLLIQGSYTDESGVLWVKSGGETWLQQNKLTMTEGCEGIEQAVQPGIPHVLTTFRVQVPADTPGEVFMTGSFPGQGWEDWLPWLILLNDAGNDIREVTLPLPVGLQIEYLFTRGDWDRVERGPSCDQIPNRTLTIGESSLIDLTIENWRDLDCGGN